MKYIIIKHLPWVRNFSSTLLNRVVSIISQILIIPIFVNLWGKEYYGEWLILCTLPNYLYASDFGINATVTNKICFLVAQDKRKEAMELFKSTNMASLLLAILFCSLYVISSYIFNWAKLMSIKLFDESIVEYTLFFLIVSVFSYFFFGLILGIYRAEGRFDKYMNFVTIIQVLDLIALLLNLYFEGSILSIAIFSFIIRLVLCSYITIDIQNKYLWFTFGFSKKMKPIVPLLPASLYYMIITVGQGLLIQGTTFFIGTQLGAATLVTFNTIRTLVNSIKSLIGTFYSSFLPNFTVMVAQNQYASAQKLFKNMFFLTLIFTLMFVIIYYFLGEIILFYWTKGKVSLQQPFFNYMLLVAFINTLSSCIYTVLNATNENKMLGIFGTIISLCTMVILYFNVTSGLTFVAIILLIGELFLFVISFTNTLYILYGHHLITRLDKHTTS